MHKNKVLLNMGRLESMKNNKWINFRFIGLLCIAFFLQQFYYATFQTIFALNNLRTEATQNNYFEQTTSEIPNFDLNVFEEVESEDEDDVQNEQAVCNVFISSNRGLKLVHYTNAINRLFLKLAGTNQHKVDLPFFILYHSWKSELA